MHGWIAGRGPIRMLMPQPCSSALVEEPTLHGPCCAGATPKQRDEIVIDPALASAVNAGPGDQVTLRASCRSGAEALPPTHFRVAGIGEFPFEAAGEHTVGGTFEAVASACGESAVTDADLILVASTGDPAATAAAIRSVRGDLRVNTNEESDRPDGAGRASPTSARFLRF